LCSEWRNRGYNVNQISEEDLLQGIHSNFLGMYAPTQDAIALNVGRINLRLEGMKSVKENKNTTQCTNTQEEDLFDRLEAEILEEMKK